MFGILVKWTHRGLNPGPSTCYTGVIPLHHVPHATIDSQMNRLLKTLQGDVLMIINVSAVGFEPTRSCLQWILSPPP